MIEYYLKMVAQFANDMKKQKLRCLLTMSGITWGTMSVILLLTFGDSLHRRSIEAMSGMGSNIVIMGGGRTTLEYKGMPRGRWIRLMDEDIDLLKAHIPEIAEISPEIERRVTLSIGKLRFNNRCIGANVEYGTMRNLNPQTGGRYINPLDIENRTRVLFLGTDVAKKLYPDNENPVGELVNINGIPFTVIGIMEDKIQNSSYMSSDRNIVFMPYSTCREMFGVTQISRIIYRADNPLQTQLMMEKTKKILSAKHGFDIEDKDAIWSWDTSEATKFLYYFFTGFKIFLLCGGALTLVVGGIGVANIMYVTIRERRREIGIKSALGATPREILSQFLLESFMIMFIGGAIGVGAAWGIIVIFNNPALSEIQKYIGKPELDLTISLVTASLLALIGFAAGMSPAKAAADMDPVKALEI